MASLGKGLNICSDPGCVNPDGYTATIKTVDNKNDAIEASGNIDEGCGPSRACVKSVKGDHKTEMHVIFEDPPIYAKEVTPNVWLLKDYVWTKDSSKNGLMVPGSPTLDYVYVGRIMIHEFGHTLGLPDFYADETTGLNGFLNGVKLPNAAMLKDAVMDTGNVINDEDIKQLRAIYLLHTAH